MNCSTEIPPSWVAAIKSGICPACGENIFDESAKQLIDEIATCLTEMPNNPSGIAGWLLANYKMSKIGDEPAHPVEFYGKKIKNQQMAILPENNAFLQRAGVDTSKLAKAHEAMSQKTNNLRNLVQEIESSQSNMYGSDDSSEDEEYEITEEDIRHNAMGARGAAPAIGNIGNMAGLQAKLAEDAEEASRINPVLEKKRLERLAAQEARSSQLSGAGRIKRAGSDD